VAITGAAHCLSLMAELSGYSALLTSMAHVEDPSIARSE